MPSSSTLFRMGTASAQIGAILAAALLWAGAADASGAYYNQGRAPTNQLTDALYDRGKALYQGRDPDHRGLEVCLAPAEDAETVVPVPAKGSEKRHQTGISNVARVDRSRQPPSITIPARPRR